MIEQKDLCEEQAQPQQRSVTILLNGPAIVRIPLASSPGWRGCETREALRVLMWASVNNLVQAHQLLAADRTHHHHPLHPSPQYAEYEDPGAYAFEFQPENSLPVQVDGLPINTSAPTGNTPLRIRFVARGSRQTVGGS